MQDFIIDSMRSSDNVNTIAVYRMEPINISPIGVLQITHGMTEYLERYKEFANMLCNAGYIVVGNDHLGHGRTSDNGGMDGYFGKKGSHKYMLGDLKNVFDRFKKEYNGLPYYLFGHSMGSFFARVFCFTYKELPDGLIISGTGGPNQMSKAAIHLADALSKVKGDKGYSPRLNDLAFKSFCNRIESPRTQMDWLTRDADIVDRYVADKKCTFKFTVSALSELFMINYQSNLLKNVRKTPATLPILFISGEEDPVGLYGAGVAEAYELYRKAGITDLKIRLYPKARHELTNEINKDEVIAQLIDWLGAHVKDDTTT